MRILTTALFVGLLAAPTVAQEPVTLTPAQIGEIFCLSRLGNDTGPITGLLTTDLSAAIADAETKDDAWAKANPGDKPPLGDGIPWQAWPDYAPRCSTDGATYMMDEASVRIRYGFPDAPDASFTDTLKLRLVESADAIGKVWRIDDIAYATDGSLREALQSAFLSN